MKLSELSEGITKERPQTSRPKTKVFQKEENQGKNINDGMLQKRLVQKRNLIVGGPENRCLGMATMNKL